MIYILGRNSVCDYDELEDIIYVASTDINDILEYLDNYISIHCLDEYTILAKQNGSTLYSEIYPTQIGYERFIVYTPYEFLQEKNKEEFEYVKEKLNVWCNKIKEEKERLQEERERKAKEAKEARERKLYEKLKAKYGE